MSDDLYIGIDLGTTYSSVAVYNAKTKRAEVISIENQQAIPSKVCYLPNGNTVVGKRANDVSYTYPKRVIFDSKRMLNKKYFEIRKFQKMWPFTIITDKTGTFRIEIDDVTHETIYPVEVSSEILKYIKINTERHLRREIKNAVITVPNAFDSNQKELTKIAAQNAGFEKIFCLSEPVAAARFCCDTLGRAEKHNVLIYDFGGGTFDIALAEISGNKIEITETEGDPLLGGQDIDNLLFDHFVDKIQKDLGIDILSNPNYKFNLKESCQTMKHNLNNLNVCKEQIMFGDKEYTLSIRKAEFNRMISEIIDKTVKLTHEVAQHCTAEKQIILIGGSSSIPLVTEKLEEEGYKPIAGVDPLFAVAIGAAMHASTEPWNRKAPAKPTESKPSQSESKPNQSESKPKQTDSKPKQTDSKPTDEEENMTIFKLAHSYGLKSVDSRGNPYLKILCKKGTRLPCSNQQKYKMVSKTAEIISLEVLMGEKLAESQPIKNFKLVVKSQKPGDVLFNVVFEINEEEMIIIKIVPLTEHIQETTFEIQNGDVIGEAQRQEMNQRNAKRKIIDDYMKLKREVEDCVVEFDKRARKDRSLKKYNDLYDDLMDIIEDDKDDGKVDYKVKYRQLKSLFDDFKKKTNI